MGKKQRRKQHHRIATQPPAQQETPTAPDSLPPVRELRKEKTVAAPARPTASWAEFRERYRYVNSELKRIGVLAASFLVVLLILTAILG